ncbi:hypothetical protein [Streptomyces sp. NPDC001276]|uniref:hypothetical protein n=1 Tax=unclassified Streptomyces TaxID=2593676 RepID=UPI00367C3D9F
MTAEPYEEQWDETERAVRSLLKTVVPAPGAPPDRMAGIRRKARRRRRRTATTVGAAVTAVSALAFVLPGLRAHDLASRERSAASKPTALVRGPAASARLLGPQKGVTVTVPQGWYALSVDDARGGPVAFIASQPLSRPARGACVSGPHQAVRTCRPLSRLARGGALIVLRHAGKSDVASGMASSPVSPSVDGCESVASKGESFLWKVGAAPVVLEVSDCQDASVTTQMSRAASKVLNSITPADGT